MISREIWIKSIVKEDGAFGHVADVVFGAHLAHVGRRWPVEEDPQALGDREDELAVGNCPTDVAGDVLGDHEGPLLVTTGAAAATATGGAGSRKSPPPTGPEGEGQMRQQDLLELS